MLERPTLVLSDTHLALDSPRELGRDLASVISAHSSAEIVLAGDVFDLSFAPSNARSQEMLTELLSKVPEVRAALHTHASQGGPITWIPGNHDAALGEDGVARTLLASLELTAGAPVIVRPWFVRRGDVHIEHGHVYDPDNAPIHPLSAWNDRTEPLGIALTRRFVAPVGARYFSHASNSTPVDALASAFRVYGRRAPGMIARYFETAIRLCV
jgi:UDP-2,3-diacylglucosamine pyrophosphatase LpxH